MKEQQKKYWKQVFTLTVITREVDPTAYADGPIDTLVDDIRDDFASYLIEPVSKAAIAAEDADAAISSLGYDENWMRNND